MPAGHLDLAGRGVSKQLIARIRLLIESRRAPRKGNKMVSGTVGRQRAGLTGVSSRAAGT
jgi:hypothetical protein